VAERVQQLAEFRAIGSAEAKDVVGAQAGRQQFEAMVTQRSGALGVRACVAQAAKLVG
jgi:hypothetical protein